MEPEPFRAIQKRERELIQRLLMPAFPGRDEVSRQLETARARTFDEDGSFEFLVEPGTGVDHVKYAVPTEGEYEDPDGVTVHVLLHVVGSAVKEIELYREDNTRVRTWPNPETLRVYAPA